MKKWKYLIPTGMLFASPWMHWLIYNNMMLAWPTMETHWAHTIGLAGSAIAGIITVLIVVES